MSIRNGIGRVARILVSLVVCALTVGLARAASHDSDDASLDLPEHASAAIGKPSLVVFGPESHYPPKPESDFLDLFRRDSDWKEAARRIQVFKFSTQFFMAIPEERLAEVVKILAAKNIRIGLEMEGPRLNPKSVPACEPEGNYSDTATVSSIIAKIGRAGGKLDYIALDEPLYYSHYDRRRVSCWASPHGLANLIAPLARLYLAAYPTAAIGDIEPFPEVSNHPNWELDIAAWVKAFAAATGKPLTFMVLDFDWRHVGLMSDAGNGSDSAAIVALAQRAAKGARAQGLEIGAIYNGNSTARSDQEWLAQAQSHMRYIEASGIRPDQAIFQSWHRYPIHSLPETDPSAFTSLIDDYFRSP